MKKLLLVFAVIVSVVACRKPDMEETHPSIRLLKENVSPEDFAQLDQLTIQQFSSQRIIRAGFKGKNPLHDFVILRLDASGKVSGGRFVHIEGSIAASSRNKHSMAFQGLIETSDLKHGNKIASAIKDGFIMELHQSAVQLTGRYAVNRADCPDCTIPEVVVSSSYADYGVDYLSWMSLWWLFTDWPKMQYIPVDYSGNGGGSSGGGGGHAPVITIDEETAENKDKIDPKKFMDCFGNVPDDGSTCTITISTDIPVDGHPEILFDWSQGFPGHAFIELYKLGQNGSLVSQNIGFYPNIGFKVLGGGNVDSKIVDNAGHEYNARYTIPITAAQLQAAIDKVNSTSGNSYNMTNFNCVDFALGVFNTAIGGGLTITKQQIPGYPTASGSSTPQALYNKLQELGSWGTPGIQTSAGKAYGGTSKGPCN